MGPNRLKVCSKIFSSTSQGKPPRKILGENVFAGKNVR